MEHIDAVDYRIYSSGTLLKIEEDMRENNKEHQKSLDVIPVQTAGILY
jgi:hypothetical protein